MAAVGSEMLRLIEHVMTDIGDAKDALETLGVMRRAMTQQNDELWAVAQLAGQQGAAG
jgi:hypothetical protein